MFKLCTMPSGEVLSHYKTLCNENVSADVGGSETQLTEGQHHKLDIRLLDIVQRKFEEPIDFQSLIELGQNTKGIRVYISQNKNGWSSASYVILQKAINLLM